MNIFNAIRPITPPHR